jgi:hypothetical protein
MTSKAADQRPTMATLRALAEDRDLNLNDQQLEAARAMHAKFRGELEKLRTVRLEYLGVYIEPATALRWIENSGRSL